MLSYEEWNSRVDMFLREENLRAGTQFPVYRIYCQDDTDRSGGGLYNETVTADTIGRFARALGDTNPLYSDPVYAEAGVYRGIIAPPLLECCICSTFIGGRFPRLRGIQVFDAGTKWERFLPIRPGDSFRAKTTYLGTRDVEKSPTGNRDRLLLREHQIDIYNQREEHVSRLTARSVIKCKAPGKMPGGSGTEEPPAADISGKVSAGSGTEGLSAGDVSSKASAGSLPEKTAALSRDSRPESGKKRPHYSAEELEEVYENLKAQSAGLFRRGSKARFWEDVEIGEILPDQIVGPYDESDGQALMAAIGVCNAFATKWDSIRRQKGPGVVDPETGARRLPIDRHSSDVIARVQGLPRAIVSGIHSQALLAKSAGDWMGDMGLLRTLDCRCRKPLFYGDLSRQRGIVEAKYETEGHSFVRLRLEALRQDGIIHTEADAVIELPRR